MTALYLLANEYRDAAEKLADMELDEQTIADTLESISGELEHKAQAVGFMIRNIESGVEAINAFTKQQQARAKALEARAEQMRGYLARCMLATGIEKISGPGIELKFRKSSAVVIDEPGLIPTEFMTAPPPPAPAPSKTLISAAIKAGREVPGAHVEARKNLQIG